MTWRQADEGYAAMWESMSEADRSAMLLDSGALQTSRGYTPHTVARWDWTGIEDVLKPAGLRKLQKAMEQKVRLGKASKPRDKPPRKTQDGTTFTVKVLADTMRDLIRRHTKGWNTNDIAALFRKANVAHDKKRDSHDIESLSNTEAYTVSYTHLRAHETKANLVCRLLLEKKNKRD